MAGSVGAPVMMRRILVVGVPAPVMMVVVRRVDGVLADFKGHPTFDVALFARGRIRREILLAYRNDVNFFLFGIRWGQYAESVEMVNVFGSGVAVVADVRSLVLVGRGRRGRRRAQLLMMGFCVSFRYTAATFTTPAAAVRVGIGIGIELLAMTVVPVATLYLVQIVQQIRQRTDLPGRAGHARPEVARLGVLQLFLEHIDDPMGGRVIVVVLVVSVVPRIVG